MTDKFFSKDPVVLSQQIIYALYNRLAHVREYIKRDVPSNYDDFSKGINYELEVEELWLSDLIDKIERS